MGRITIKDIAKLLEVNPSTISRALKDHPDISVEMKERVKKIAQELGYTPNFQAISFRNRKSRLIGLIIPDMNMFFFPAVIKAVEERVRAEGYNLLVLHSNNQLNGEISNIKIARYIGLEGLLISLSSESATLQHFQEIKEQGTPMVFFDRVAETDQYPTISIRDQQVAHSAVAHLVQQGHRQIGGIFGDPKISISRLRLQGFQESLQQFGLPVRPEFILHARTTAEAKARVEQLFDRPHVPNALFVMSDELLVGVMQAFHQKKVRYPEEVSLIAISNGEVPNFWNPPVPYLHHSGHEVGRLSANVLFDLIHKRSVEKEHWVATELVFQNPNL